MNDIHYCVIDQNEDRVLARGMSLHDALLFIQALFERYSLPDNVAYTIRQEDDRTKAVPKEG
ncbi:MAG: hypothetical protein IKS93_04355 [Methanobrevibacter sp.]|nr:hypothetical protein [Methanobrevibacter sp.]